MNSYNSKRPYYIEDKDKTHTITAQGVEIINILNTIEGSTVMDAPAVIKAIRRDVLKRHKWKKT